MANRNSTATRAEQMKNPNLKQRVRFGIVLEAGRQDGALLFREDSAAAVGAALPRAPPPTSGGRRGGLGTGRLLPSYPAPISVLPSLLSYKRE
jgi:hypothetical protein